MSFPVAAGKVNIGSAAMQYIPKLYAQKLLVKYYDSTVLSMITNTQYEGMIRKMGDEVIIRERPTLTIRDYVKGQTLVNEQPEATSQSMLIDKGKYWSFVIEDLDKVQTDIKNYVNEWTADAAEQLKITIDTLVLAGMASGANASNSGATAGRISADIDLGTGAAPEVVDKTNVLDYIVNMGTVLDEQNVPESNRWIVMPAWMAGMIKKSDLKDASLSGDSTSIIRNGLIGMIDRFKLFSSNLLPAVAGGGGGTAVLFGHSDATSFATQMTESKIVDNPNGFGSLHRGLQVFGYKVTKSEALGLFVAKK